MFKYKGSRGYRDYNREANELKKPAVVLAVLNALALIFAGVCFIFVHTNRPVVAQAVYAEVAESAVPVFLSVQEPVLASAVFLDVLDLPPIIPIEWGSGIFFDTYTSTLVFPSNIGGFLIEQNYYRREFTISFEEVDFLRKSIPLVPYDILPMRITTENEKIQIRTRYGALIESHSTETDTYIQIINPRERYSTVVIIDAGHGGHDPGAPSVLRNSPPEAEITLAITQKILENFDHPDILLIPTRTGDYFMSTSSRTRIANNIADYFISIHCNADARSNRSRGMLTLYGTAEGSYELAKKFQNALVSALGSFDRGVQYAPQFHILRESNIPVVLLEILFLSNPQDAALLADQSTQRLIADTIIDVIKTLN